MPQTLAGTSIDVPLPDSLRDFLSRPHCVDVALPAPGSAEVCLPLGGKLKGMADITKSIPDDCTLTFSLLLQLGPIMASTECLIKVLGMIKPGIDVLNALKTGNIPKVVGAVPALIEAAEKVLPCVAQIAIGVPMFVRDLLLLLAKTLKCLGQQLRSIAELMGGLQIAIQSATASNNTELLAQLQCAQENAANSAMGAMQAVDPIKLLLALAEPFLSIAGVDPFEFPVLGASTEADALKTAATTLETIGATMKSIAEKLPGC